MRSHVRTRKRAGIKAEPDARAAKIRALAAYRGKIMAAKKDDHERMEELVSDVRKLARTMPFQDVLETWEKEVSKKPLPEFLLAIAWISPKLVHDMTPERAGPVYRLLGTTLRKVPERFREGVAHAMMRAIIYVRGAVQPAARAMVREHKDALMRYPDVWRNIGSFAR